MYLLFTASFGDDNAKREKNNLFIRVLDVMQSSSVSWLPMVKEKVLARNAKEKERQIPNDKPLMALSLFLEKKI